MAKRPPGSPKWAALQYGGDALAWDEAKKQCRNALHQWASQGRYGFYSDLVPLVPALPWPEGPHTQEGHQIGMLLGKVCFDELDIAEDRPLISALVVSKEENLPSYGFWNLLEELDIHVGRRPEGRLDFWVKELKRCFEVFGKR